VLVGADVFADAGVYRLRDDLALVQTVDFFPPICDDPYVFGQIAAANSLSDVYAMGGVPITALNIMGFPTKELPLSLMERILEGGYAKAAEAGCIIIGGHTVKDAEVKYGLAVTGRVDPHKLITLAGARPGDVLMLTKPIGTGSISIAYKKGTCAEEVAQEAFRWMTALNADASAAMVALGVDAATDITGFGLLGHAGNMASASGVSLRITASAVPLLPGAEELARASVFTGTASAVGKHLADRVRFDAGVGEHVRGLLLDAQTSGGLLIAIAAGQESLLAERLANSANAMAVEIGRVEKGAPGHIHAVA
jgi:selenide,water dikinase